MSFSEFHVSTDPLATISLPFSTTIDFLQSTVRVVFVHKARQDPSVSGPLRKEMLTCFQAHCVEANANTAYVTTARWNFLETTLRQRCAAAQVAMIFESNVPLEKACSFQTPDSPTANLVTETTTLVALG